MILYVKAETEGWSYRANATTNPMTLMMLFMIITIIGIVSTLSN